MSEIDEQEEWGPWIDATQDLSQLVVGSIAQGYMKTGRTEELSKPKKIENADIIRMVSLVITIKMLREYGENAILNYRILKPRGLTILTAILREVEREGGNGCVVEQVKEVEM